MFNPVLFEIYFSVNLIGFYFKNIGSIGKKINYCFPLLDTETLNNISMLGLILLHVWNEYCFTKSINSYSGFCHSIISTMLFKVKIFAKYIIVIFSIMCVFQSFNFEAVIQT